MRVVLDATALGSGLGGDETMLRGLLRGLALTAEPGDELRVLAAHDGELPDRGRGQPGRCRSSGCGGCPGPLHFGARLPWRLDRHDRDADVVFSVTHAPVRSPDPAGAHGAGPVVPPPSRPLPPRHPPAARATRAPPGARGRRRHDRERLLPRRHHRHLRPGSRAGAHRAEHGLGAGAARARRPGPAAEAWLAEQGVRAPYFLYLGNLHPRKNVATALRAFTRARATDPALADHQFVVAGARWWGEGETTAADAAPAGSVLLVGRVDDDVRQVLLEQAVALVYLSMFEGFGLPPLEAMAAGTPVLASTAAAIPEVTGGAAVLCDPLDLRAIAAALSTIASDDTSARRPGPPGPRARRPLRPDPHRHLRPPRPARRPRSRRSRHDRHPSSARHDRRARSAADGRHPPAGPPASARGVADYAADWEANAQADARYAILSDPATKGGTWDDDTFMSTGELEIARVFAELDRLGVVVSRRGTCLDFGCGLGRLTQALGRRFDQAIGVDVSPTMVAEATELAAAGGIDNVRFVLNQQPAPGPVRHRLDRLHLLEHRPPARLQRPAARLPARVRSPPRTGRPGRRAAAEPAHRRERAWPGG